MARIIRWTVMGVRFITPWLFKVVVYMLRLAAIAASSLWVGIPVAVGRMADKWTDQALNAGVPSIYDTFLYHAIQVVAFLVIVLGWVVLAFTTVWILRFILHF